MLSLGEDEAATIYLTQRTTADVADSPESLEAALQPFAAALFRWRERLGLEGKKPAEAAEEGEVRSWTRVRHLKAYWPNSTQPRD